MKKNILSLMALGLMFTDEYPTHNPNPKSKTKLDEDRITRNFKRRKDTIHKGHTKFTMEDGTEIYALNYKNARRKFQQMILNKYNQ